MHSTVTRLNASHDGHIVVAPYLYGGKPYSQLLPLPATGSPLVRHIVNGQSETPLPPTPNVAKFGPWFTLFLFLVRFYRSRESDLSNGSISYLTSFPFSKD